MKKIFGFLPEEATKKLKDLQAKGTAGLPDRLDLFEKWLLNIERRLRVIEKSLKTEYPEDEPKE